jgi:hypothetical protein
LLFSQDFRFFDVLEMLDLIRDDSANLCHKVVMP